MDKGSRPPDPWRCLGEHWFALQWAYRKEMSHDISALRQILCYEADSLCYEADWLRGLKKKAASTAGLPRVWYIYDSFVPHEAGNGQQYSSLHRGKRQTAVSWAISRGEDGDRLSERSMVRGPRIDRTQDW